MQIFEKSLFFRSFEDTLNMVNNKIRAKWTKMALDLNFEMYFGISILIIQIQGVLLPESELT